MRYNSFQKKFIVHICEYKTNIQGFLFKDILQSFLKNKYGLEVENNGVFILANNKKVRNNSANLNDYTYEIYSLIYLLYELKQKELIYFSTIVINNDFKYSITNFKNDYRIDIKIDKEKSKFFLEAINSQIFISSEVRPFIICKRFFFDTDKFLFIVGVVVSFATILSTILDMLEYFKNK